MRKDTAGPSVKSNTEVEIEEKAKLTAKTSTASKDDKTEADQKPPSMAEPPSLRTKAVDKILAGRKSLIYLQKTSLFYSKPKIIKLRKHMIQVKMGEKIQKICHIQLLNLKATGDTY